MNVAAPKFTRPPGGKPDSAPGQLALRGRAATRQEEFATADQQRHAGDFAELLQRKSQCMVESDGPADPAPGFAAVPAPALARGDASPILLRAPREFSAPEALQPALRALQHAAAVDAPATPVAEAVTHASWEVSVNTPGGVPLRLEATRLPDHPQNVRGGWVLTLTAPARETAALNRHAPRLNERLRERALSREPLRVEADDAGDPP